MIAVQSDLNPIEQAFAKLKVLLRKAAARTRDALRTTIGGLLDVFGPSNTQLSDTLSTNPKAL